MQYTPSREPHHMGWESPSYMYVCRNPICGTLTNVKFLISFPNSLKTHEMPPEKTSSRDVLRPRKTAKYRFGDVTVVPPQRGLRPSLLPRSY